MNYTQPQAAQAKCKCQHCDQSIAFDSDEAGRTVKCPACGMDTLLFIPPSNKPVQKEIRSNSEKIRQTAKGLVNAAIFFCVIAGIVMGFTIVAASMAEYPNSGDVSLAIGGSIIGGLLTLAGWLYLVAQIIYIRANTQKD